MEVTRIVFYLLNKDAFDLTLHSFLLISKGGLLYDTMAIAYFNAPWLLTVLLPLRRKERPGFWKAERLIYVVFNSSALLMNLCDSVFFAYRQQRTTMALLDEFGGEGGLGTIIFHEALSHWYLVLLFIAMVAALWFFYRPVNTNLQPPKRYYISRSVGLAVWGFLLFWGARGCPKTLTSRPLSINYAHRYTTRPIDAALVLNTQNSCHTGTAQCDAELISKRDKCR